MTSARKVVLVASGSSPDRAIAVERLLAAAAARSGWADRVEIRLGGIDGGAGRISDAGRAALASVGIDAEGAVCPDLERRLELLDGASLIVCDRGDVADVLVDWKEAGEAEFVCVDEVSGATGADEEAAETPIAGEVRSYEQAIDEVLRRVVAAA
jgi:hypothetical protein